MAALKAAALLAILHQIEVWHGGRLVGRAPTFREQASTLRQRARDVQRVAEQNPEPQWQLVKRLAQLYVREAIALEKAAEDNMTLDPTKQGTPETTIAERIETARLLILRADATIETDLKAQLLREAADWLRGITE